MDEVSTGSTISKGNIKYVYKDSILTEVTEEEVELPKLIHEEVKTKEMTIDDFINDFKL